MAVCAADEFPSLTCGCGQDNEVATPDIFKNEQIDFVDSDPDNPSPTYAWERAFDHEFGRWNETEVHEKTAAKVDFDLWNLLEEEEAEGDPGYDRVMEFLKAGADPNHRAGISGKLPVLHLATSYGYVESMRALLDAGADIKGLDSEGWQPIHIAVNHGMCEAILLLVSRGADPNAQIEVIQGSVNGDFGEEDFEIEYGQCGMHWASHVEDPEDGVKVVEALASVGGIVDVKTSLGKLPIHWATCLNNIPVVTKLVELGSDIDAWDGEFNTPLVWASRLGRKDMVFKLLELGANPHKTARNGCSALFWAEQLFWEDIADELRLYGVRPWKEGIDEGEDFVGDHLEVQLRLPTP